MKNIRENHIDESLFLFFTWAVRNENNEVRYIDLCEDGYNIPLVEKNKNEYIDRVIKFITYDTIKGKINCFLNGFRSVIPLNIIQIFEPRELDFIISGQKTIDVRDWKQNTIYKGTFYDNHNVSYI